MSLKFGILGLLAEQPLHGYDVKNRFESLLGGSWDVNIGQVYTTLQRLEREGLIEADGKLDQLLAAQRRVYLQRLKDLAELEQRARQAGRDDLVLLFMGALLHTEADLKWTDACADEIRNSRPKGGEAS